MAPALFGKVRRFTYVILFVLAGVQLGLSANLTNLFLNLHHDYLIFSLVPPSITLLFLLVLLARGQPRIDLVAIAIMAILWLSLGAYSNDVIGFTQCDLLTGQTVRTNIGGTYSAQSLCYQMKVIEAIAWADFGLFLIFFWLLLSITLNMAGRGENAWAYDIDDLMWFGATGGAGVPGGRVGGGGGYPYGQYGQGQYGQYGQGQGQQYPQYYANGAASQYSAPTAPPVAQTAGFTPIRVEQPGRDVLIHQGVNGPEITTAPPRRSGDRLRRTSDARR